MERAQINFARHLEITNGQFRVIHFGGETLFCPRIFRRGKSAANIASDDLRLRAQLRESPHHIVEREPSALPIRGRVLRPQTIEIDRDVNVRAGQSLDKLRELCPPVRGNDCAPSILLRSRAPVGPGMNFQFTASFGTPVSKELPRPPALEIAASPDADLLDKRKFERTINPAAATPPGRAHIPIRMIIERNKHERFAEPPNPECG